MSKSETVRQLAVVANERRIASSTTAIDEVVEKMREANEVAINGLASGLEPLAQSMAGLIDQTKKSLEDVKTAADESTRKLDGALAKAGSAWSKTTSDAQIALEKIERQVEAALGLLDNAKKQRRRAAWLWGLVSGVALMTGLAIASWIWLGPQGQPYLVEAVRIRIFGPK